MPKISELNALTSSQVLDTDLLAIAHDVNGLPSTKKITFSEFTNAISTAVTSNYTYANTTSAGVVKVGNYLTVNSTGYINAQQSTLPTSDLNEGYILTWDDVANAAIWAAFSGVEAYTLINSANSYNATKHDYNIACNPNSISDNIRIVLPDPTSNPPAITGKIYTVKNLDPGAGYVVSVTTQSGLVNGSNYIEDPVTGAFIISYDLVAKGSGDSWLFDGTAYRHVISQRAVPTFYTSADTYAQVVFKNASAANNASSDMVGYNNIGNENAGTGPFIDMGINSSNYNDTTYGNVWGPSDAYLYNYGGNLIIGPQTDHSVKILAGNTNAENVKLTVNTSAVYVNSTMVLINTTPSASPEIINIYSEHNINISASNKILKIDTSGTVTLPGILQAPQSTKANNSVGTAGMISWDSNSIYVCVGTNSWKKVSLSNF